MGEFAINPAFLNKILSMAKAGIGWKHHSLLIYLDIKVEHPLVNLDNEAIESESVAEEMLKL